MGTDVSGAAAQPNYTGVFVAGSTTVGGTSPGARNLISGNSSAGLAIGVSNNVIEGNRIGTDKTGGAALGNGVGIEVASLGISSTSNVIGGTAPGAGNQISGNGGGIILRQLSGANRIEGNLVGTNSTGMSALGNSGLGIWVDRADNNTIGGTTPAHRNVIAGSGHLGVFLEDADENELQGNYIGTDASGTGAIPNSGGVVIDRSASQNLVGGTAAGAGNVIAFSGGGGVTVGSGTRNAFLGNSIRSNGGMGIELVDPCPTFFCAGVGSVTPNDPDDADTGPNQFQNFPELTSYTHSGGATVAGTLDSEPDTTYRIEFFANDSCDPSGHGEGQTPIGSTNVTTDSGGDASFQASLPVSLGAGKVITATATDPDGNTSEFSACEERTGPLAHWPLGDPGTTAEDIADGHDGTYRGSWSTIEPDAFGPGSATRFHGTGGRVDVPDLGSSADFTIEGFERILSGGAQPANGNHTLYARSGAVRLLPRPNGVYAGVWIDGTEYTLQRSTPSNVGIWAHWALVRDGSTLRLYRNGVELGQRSGLPTDPGRITGTIGRQGTAYSAHADIDEVIVHDQALSPAQLGATSPLAPGTPVADRPTNTGAFRLDWKPNDANPAPVTYTLEHKPEGEGGDWSTVADDLSQPTFAFTAANPEAEGTWIYRVRANSGGDSSNWSEPSDPVTVEGPSRYPAEVLGEPSLLGYWRLGESSGTVARDSAGQQDGRYVGPGYSLGAPGALADDPDTAASFDGTGGRVDIPDLGSSVDFTIEGFERIVTGGAQPPNGNHTLYARSGRVRLLPRPNGFYAGVWIGGIEYNLSRATAANTGAWVHWALVREGTALRVYRDGVLAGQRSGLPPDPAQITGQIARQGTAYSAHADIDEAAVYGAALSQARIQAHVEASREPPIPTAQ